MTRTEQTEGSLARLEALGLRGVVEHWQEFEAEACMPRLIEVEELDRGRRGLERRLRNAKLGRFKSFADFDGSWPKKLDQEQLEEVFTLGFIEEAANVILVGPNGVGKTMIAKNLAYEAVLRGHTARFVTASELLVSAGRKARIFAGQPAVLPGGMTPPSSPCTPTPPCLDRA